jgi:hypothetical protein
MTVWHLPLDSNVDSYCKISDLVKSFRPNSSHMDTLCFRNYIRLLKFYFHILHLVLQC